MILTPHNRMPHAALYVPAPGGGGTDAILLETGDKLLLEAGGQVDLDTGIPAQSEATTLDGTEWFAIVQGGVTVKIAALTLAEYING